MAGEGNAVQHCEWNDEDRSENKGKLMNDDVFSDSPKTSFLNILKRKNSSTAQTKEH